MVGSLYVCIQRMEFLCSEPPIRHKNLNASQRGSVVFLDTKRIYNFQIKIRKHKETDKNSVGFREVDHTINGF